MNDRTGYDTLEQKILDGKYDMFDRVLYGGIAHGIMVLPTNLFKIIFTVLFPPIGEIMNAASGHVLGEFPYITWDTVDAVYQNLQRIIYSFILTALFYVPGLIYTLSNISLIKFNTAKPQTRGVIKVRKF